MTVFQMSGVKTVETWKKLEMILSALYSHQRNSVKKEIESAAGQQSVVPDYSVLNKQSLIILTAILAEQNISNVNLWDCI